jgi:AcrR family transcriptional regulator
MASILQPAPPLTPHATRFDRRFSNILDFATEVFAEKGYEGASMRDLSRLSGISLAGLYYYFESKEKLLYSIQRHTLGTIIQELRERLAGETDPEKRLRIFVHNHVEYSLERPKAMKVLSHEDDVLTDNFGAELAEIKRQYYQLCVGLVEEVLKHDLLNAKADHQINARIAVMSLFGAINWLYTWHKPEVDPDADTLARQICDLFLDGVRGATANYRVRSAPLDRSGSRKTTSQERP